MEILVHILSTRIVIEPIHLSQYHQRQYTFQIFKILIYLNCIIKTLEFPNNYNHAPPY